MTSSRYLHSIILYLRYSVPILLLFFLSSNVLGISVPAPQGNINDFAGVLSKEWKTTLTELTHQIEQNTSVQVAVVIINSLGDVDKESYALAIGEQWGVGQKNKDNGIVFLIALQEREYRIEIGKGLEGTLNDAKVGRIARTYLVSAFKREEYGQGIYDTLEAIRNVISQEPDTPLASEDTSGIIHLILLGWLVLVIILASVQRDISLTKRYTRFGLGSGIGVIAGFFFSWFIGIDIFFYALTFLVFFAIINSPRVPKGGKIGGWLGGFGGGGLNGGGSSGGFGGGGFGGGGAGGGW